MVKIFLHGVMVEDNFGGPSLIHGAEEIVKELDPQTKIVCYQNTRPSGISISDFDFPVRQIPYQNAGQLLLDALRLKFGIKPKTEERKRFFNDLISSDVVANLLGICFCANFRRGRRERIKSALPFLSPLFAIRQFPISFVAKLFGIKSVKTPASYGPVKDRFDQISARFSANHIFNVMYAREKESQKQMKEKARVKKNINVAPDLANFWSSIHGRCHQESTIGISVSHQIIRQWNSSENYLDCIVNLIRHIKTNITCQIMLIPNEIAKSTSYNDIHVAQDIVKRLGNSEKVQILDVSSITSTELKGIIAGLEVVVASRYHSCVAALSSGVPVLVIGWHHKYEELLSLYAQERWIISCENCSSEKLIRMFDSFWASKDNERAIIEEKYQDVRNSLFEAGQTLFVR